jgi:hypothetical protein
MNKRTYPPRITISAIAMAVIGFGFASTVSAGDHLFDTYNVLPGKSNNPNHSNADYVVFDVPGPFAGIFFIEKTGPFKFQPFYCDDAVWSASNEAYSCWRLATLGPHAIKETVTVGTITGPFCETMRAKHNTKGKETKIVTSDDPECRENQKCTCYEITHACWSGSGYNQPCPPGLSDELKDLKSDSGDDAFAPPGSGAGSGRAH